MNKKASAVFLMMALFCFVPAACGSPRPQSAEQSEASSSVNQEKTAEEDAAAEAERQAEKERLQGLEEVYLNTVAEKDDWADGLVLDSLRKLADEGVIAPLPEDFEMFTNIFEFMPTDTGYDIYYLDETAKEALAGDFSLDLSDGSKVALCCEYHMLNEDGSRLRDLTVPYTNKDNAFHYNNPNEDLLSTPTLAPDGWAGTFAALRERIPEEVFADTVDDCRYLLAYGSCEANIAEDYYSISPVSEGIIDRTDMTTIVVVIDTAERKVLHIENIGTDVPEGTTTTPYGSQLTEEALEYIGDLLEKA